MAYSRVKYVVDGTTVSTKTFSYAAFATLGVGADPESDQFKVYLDNTLLTKNTHYTVNETNNTITLIGSVASTLVQNQVVALERDTRKLSRYVNWTNNAGIDESDLDLDGDQLLFIAQEAIDEGNTALRKTPSETAWDGEGLPSINCAPATDGTGWTTLNQVYNLIEGAETGTVGTVNTWCFDGNGSTVNYLLNGAASNTTVNSLFVTLDGITLCPCDDDVPFSLLLERAATALYARETTFQGLSSVTNSLWDDALLAETDAVNQLLGRPYSGNLTNNDKFPGIVVYYEIKVTIRNGGSGPVPTIPTTFVGTAAECQAFLDTWTDQGTTDTHSGTIRYHHVEGPEYGYSYNSETNTLTFNVAPPLGASICVRQITGTVAVDIANLSMDGSELKDNSIELRHIDMNGETYFTFDKDTGTTSNVWPANTNKVLAFDSLGNPYLGLLNKTFIHNWTSEITSFRLNQLTIPNASINLNTNKIINLLAGSSNNDAVNLGQMNAAITPINTRLNYDIGVPPNNFYNNYSNIRNTNSADVYDPYPAVGCRLEQSPNDSNILFKGFIPRFITIRMYGSLTRLTDNGSMDTLVDCEWQAMLNEIENGFTPYSTETYDGTTRRVYILPPPRDFDAAGVFAFPGSTNANSFQLICEQTGQKRVWFRVKNNAATPVYAQLRARGGTTGIGSLSVSATKGM